MVNRIKECFDNLKLVNKPAFIPFITAGDPNKKDSLELINKLPKLGADIIEIGMPFSDPMADGKIIQDSSLRALKNSIKISDILSMIKEFRKDNLKTPIVLMGYYNPIYTYGTEKFILDANNSGVDGLIVVDLPSEHDEELFAPCLNSGIDFIRLVAPTTTDKRLKKIVSNANGFIYCISIAGITGTQEASLNKVIKTIHNIRKFTDLPIAVGFGIKTPEQAKMMASKANAIVVGSVIVNKILEVYSQNKEPKENLLSFIKSFADKVHSETTNL